MNRRSQTGLSLIIALIAGASTLFSFAPYSFWAIQIASLAVFIHLTLKARSTSHSLFIGWAYGFGWSVCGIYWLFISMHRYGGLAAPLAVLAVILMALVLGLFPAITGTLAYWLAKRWSATLRQTCLLLFPALWAITEWMRGWVFTGFPWVTSGYAHTGSPLSGYAPIIGTYGIGLLAMLIAGCVFLLFSAKEQKKRFFAAICAIAILIAGSMLGFIKWTAQTGSPVSVRLLQGNVPQEMKFSPEQRDATLDQYQSLIKMAPADLIATPETALPSYLHQLPPDYMNRLAQFAARTQSTIAIGIPYADPMEPLIKPASGMNGKAHRTQQTRHITEIGEFASTEQRSHSPAQSLNQRFPRPFYANSLIVITPNTLKQQEATYRYDKHHLVPFGEFIPMGSRWFINLMRIPLGDFNRGALLQAPFAVKDQWILPNICYEDLFGEEIAAKIAEGRVEGHEPSMMLNISNIAWFGNTHAIPQHLQISQMRALEMRRPMLRATNTGATAVISARGEILDQLPYFTEGSLATSVQGYTGITPYILFRNVPVVMLALLFLLIVKLRSMRVRRNKKNRHVG